MDYPGGHCNHGVLIRGSQGGMMTDVVVRVTWSQVKECRQLLRDGKDKEWILPGAPEGTHLCQHFHFSPVRTIPDS